MTANTIKTRILILSDTHCATPSHSLSDTSPFHYPLPAADVVLHCGDLTYEGTIPQFNTALDLLSSLSAPLKLVIAGNHDLQLDRDFLLSHLHRENRTAAQAEDLHAQSRDLWNASTSRARAAGITLLDEGLHSIPLPNGAILNLYASPFTPEFCDWGFPYARNEDRFNPPAASLSDAKNISVTPVPDFPSSSQANSTSPPIDILLTHGPPLARLDKTNTAVSAGCAHLWRATMRSRPLIHCFGHIHEGWGAERVRWAEDVSTTASAGASLVQWRKGVWERGVEGIESVQADLELAKQRHAVELDVSQSGPGPVVRGRETLLVNAAIMDVDYKPVNAPWLIEVDLPRRE